MTVPRPRMFCRRPDRTGTGTPAMAARAAGFTLLEMLVSLAIFALLSLAGIGVLRFVVDSRAATGTRAALLGQIERANAIMAADFAQLASRAARDDRGDARQGAFLGVDPALSTTPPSGPRIVLPESAAPFRSGPGGPEVSGPEVSGQIPGGARGRTIGTAPPRERLIFQFVRRGWENYDDAPRASLQFVQYSLIDGRLERRARPMVDGAAMGQAQVLFEDVQALQVQFRAGDRWIGSFQSTPNAALPPAVRVAVVLRGFADPVSQIFLTSAAQT